jgi:hypothetical protein
VRYVGSNVDLDARRLVWRCRRCGLVTWGLFPQSCERLSATEAPSLCDGKVDREPDEVQDAYQAAFLTGGWNAVFELVVADDQRRRGF